MHPQDLAVVVVAVADVRWASQNSRPGRSSIGV